VDNQPDDDFLILREKTQDEAEREEEKYRAFLEREVGDLREVVRVDGLGGDEEPAGEHLEDEGVQTKKRRRSHPKQKKTKSSL